MSPLRDIRKQILDLFNQSKTTTTVHQKNSMYLYKLVNKAGETFAMLRNVIFSILQAEESVYVERLIHFIGAFYVTLKQKEITKNSIFASEGCPLASKLLYFLLEVSAITNDNVRLNSLKMIHEILNALVDVEIEEKICEDLEENLIDRLWDPKMSVKLQALKTLSRLQNYDNPEDRIIKQFLLLTAVPSAKIRRRAIELVAARGDVMQYFVRSTRDKDPAVRLAALKRLESKAEYLEIQDKCDILLFVLTDKTPSIQKHVPILINSWVKCYDNSVIQFMKSLRVGADGNQTEQAVFLHEKVLYVIFRNTGLSKLSGYLQITDKVIPYDQLNYENACYWRSYLEYLHSKGDYFEEEVEKMIPELPYFVKYILGFCNNLKTKALTDDSEQQYILKQMFLMTRVFDYADVASRKCLNGLVQYVLHNLTLSTETTNVVILALESSIPLATPRTQFVSEIISEIISPIDLDAAEQTHEVKEFELAQLKVEINCIASDLEEAVQERNFLRADILKKELEEKELQFKRLKEERYVQQETTERKNDVPTLIKCLDIAVAAASSKQVTQLTPALRTLKDSLIPDVMEHDSWIIKSKALKFYAICCIMDKTIVPTGMQIFTALIYSYTRGEKFEKEILQVCLYAVSDLLLLHGTTLVASPNNGVNLSESTDEDHQQVFAGSSISEIVEALLAIINNQENENVVKEWVYLIICKLMSNRIFMSTSLISLLIMKWCKPDGDTSLCCIIGQTLQNIARVSEYSQNLQEASILTIDLLLNDDSEPQVEQVTKEDVMKFVIALCKTSSKRMEIQAVLGTDICCRIRDCDDVKTQTLLTKLLLSLDIPPDGTLLEHLMELCDEIKDGVTNKKVRANITKFVAMLHSTYEKIISNFAAEEMPKHDEHSADEMDTTEDEDSITDGGVIDSENEI